jgi:hypothetical protein
MASSKLYKVSPLGVGSLEVTRSLKERTVLCTWDYVPNSEKVNHKVMYAMLGNIIDTRDIQTMGTLNKAFQWHCTLRSADATDRLVAEKRFVFKDVLGVDHPVNFSPLRQHKVRFQVLWVPAHVSNLSIRELLVDIAEPNGGRVTMCTRDFLPIGEGWDTGCYTTRFSCEIENIWPEKIPDRMTLDVGGERFPILFLVRGRPRACFMCGCFGHSQSECLHPKCKYCREEGHKVVDCKKKGEKGPGYRICL